MVKNWAEKLLSEFVKIQSVSTDRARFPEILKGAEFLKTVLRSLGFKVFLCQKEKVPPLVIGEKILNSSHKTIGIYGHYDVQPEDPLKNWRFPPFKLTLSKGRFWGRGVADNKGPIVQNLTAVKNLLQKGELKSNIVFIFEGEEETGSAHFEDFLREQRGILKKVDLFYLTDVGMHKEDTPQVIFGLRGLVYFELEVKIGDQDLHSGLWGGMVENPLLLLSRIFSKVKNEEGKITIPGFYKGFKKPSYRERGVLKRALKKEEEELRESKAYVLSYEKEYPLSLSAKIRPSFDIHGIKGGYTGEGLKTVIPFKATAKFSFRLVENQSPKEIKKMVENFIRENLPKGIKYKLKTLCEDPPFYIDPQNKYLKKTVEILKEVFGGKVLLNRSGGSIASAQILQKNFKKPIILTGFVPPSSNIHSPNENFDLRLFFKGIKALERTYSKFY